MVGATVVVVVDGVDVVIGKWRLVELDAAFSGRWSRDVSYRLS